MQQVIPGCNVVVLHPAPQMPHQLRERSRFKTHGSALQLRGEPLFQTRCIAQRTGLNQNLKTFRVAEGPHGQRRTHQLQQGQPAHAGDGA